MFMTYSTFCCHFNKLRLYGMYVHMYVCMYVHMYSVCFLAVHSLSTRHLCFSRLDNIHHLLICSLSYLVELLSVGLHSPGHTDCCDDVCRMEGHVLEGQVAGLCKHDNEVLCLIKCKAFVDYLRNCVLFKEKLCMLDLVVVTCSWLVVLQKFVMFDIWFLLSRVT
jgi:hypothetical protein